MPTEDSGGVVCRGPHLGSEQFAHERTEMVPAAVGDGETRLRCPECSTVVEEVDP